MSGLGRWILPCPNCHGFATADIKDIPTAVLCEHCHKPILVLIEVRPGCPNCFEQRMSEANFDTSYCICPPNDTKCPPRSHPC